MVIVDITAGDLRSWRSEIASKGNAFGAYAECWRVVWNGVVGGKRTRFGPYHGPEVVGPVAMAIGVLAAKPANEITIEKMKAEECAGVEPGPIRTERG